MLLVGYRLAVHFHPTPKAIKAQGSDEMLPPTILMKEETIHTFCPNMAMGIIVGGVLSALTSEGFDELEVELFVTDLWTNVGAGGWTGLQGLYLIPALASFPFAVDEGKGYMISKQLSVAENQAAGSGVRVLSGSPLGIPLQR